MGTFVLKRKTFSIWTGQKEFINAYKALEAAKALKGEAIHGVKGTLMSSKQVAKTAAARKELTQNVKQQVAKESAAVKTSKANLKANSGGVGQAAEDLQKNLQSAVNTATANYNQSVGAALKNNQKTLNKIQKVNTSFGSGTVPVQNTSSVLATGQKPLTNVGFNKKGVLVSGQPSSRNKVLQNKQRLQQKYTTKQQNNFKNNYNPEQWKNSARNTPTSQTTTTAGNDPKVSTTNTTKNTGSGWWSKQSGTTKGLIIGGGALGAGIIGTNMLSGNNNSQPAPQPYPVYQPAPQY